MNVGLTRYEAMVYLATMTNGHSSAKKVSELTGIPYCKIYEVIGSLIRKGFLCNAGAKPLRFYALHPKKALTNIKIKMNEKLKELEDLLAKELENSKDEVEKSISIMENGIHEKIEEACTNGSYICGSVDLLKKFLPKLEEKKNLNFLILKSKKTKQKEIRALKEKIKEFDGKAKVIPSESRVLLFSNRDLTLILETMNGLNSDYNGNFKAIFFSNTSFPLLLTSILERTIQK